MKNESRSAFFANVCGRKAKQSTTRGGLMVVAILDNSYSAHVRRTVVEGSGGSGVLL